MYTFKLGNQTINIKFGDIFKENGFKVIPFNEEMDDVVDEKRIKSCTLHGKFLNKYFKEEFLQIVMDGAKFNATGDVLDGNDWFNCHLKGVENGRCQFELGSTLKYKDFLLVAFAKFDENLKAHLNYLEYDECMERMWHDIYYLPNFYNFEIEDMIINLPVMGTGLTNLDFLENQDDRILKYVKLIEKMLRPIKGEFTGSTINIIFYYDMEFEIDINEIGRLVEERLSKDFDFYIASGFFNDEQLEQVEYIKAELDKRGFTYFSPKDESQVEDISTRENRLGVFNTNKMAINNSRAMIVNTNNKDMGTIWESGYGFAKGLDVIYLHLDKKEPFNLMLSESAMSSCATKEQFIETLNGYVRYWKETVE